MTASRFTADFVVLGALGATTAKSAGRLLSMQHMDEKKITLMQGAGLG
jgi:hypothetical protein